MKSSKVAKNSKTKNNQLVADSIRALPQQMLQVVADWPKVNKPQGSYKEIIVCGMGGSTLSADIIRYGLADMLTIPIRIVNDYQLPSFAKQLSLVIVSSYSGTTEEALACYAEAQRKKLPLFVITTGGKLAAQAVRDNTPRYIFEPRFNPSRQPRLGLGYGVAALLLLLADLRVSSITASKIIRLTKEIKKTASKKEVDLVRGRSIIIVASEHLIGVAHAMSNQMNETAKIFAPYFTLPELNHHLLEGLASLAQPKKQWLVIFLSSGAYDNRTSKRYQLTEKIFQKQKFATYEKSFLGDRLLQALRCLYWSASLTYEVAVAEGLDTTSIPWVNYFKQQLH